MEYHKREQEKGEDENDNLQQERKNILRLFSQASMT